MYAFPYRGTFGHFLRFCCYTQCCNKHSNPNALHTCFAGNTSESLAGGLPRKPCEDCCADGATCLQTSGMTPSPLSPAFQTSPRLRDATFKEAFSSPLLCVHPTVIYGAPTVCTLMEVNWDLGFFHTFPNLMGFTQNYSCSTYFLGVYHSVFAGPFCGRHTNRSDSMRRL